MTDLDPTDRAVCAEVLLARVARLLSPTDETGRPKSPSARDAETELAVKLTADLPASLARMAEHVRASALHEAFWAVHALRFSGSDAALDTFYVGIAHAKAAISKLHGSPITQPRPEGVQA